MVTEAFVARDQVEWWIDTGATRHILGNRNSFTTYELVGAIKFCIWETHPLLRLWERELLN